MIAEKLADGFSSLFDETEMYHNSLISGNKIWAFGQKFKKQESHNWGHRIVFAGTYAAVFDLGTKSWSKCEIPAVSNEENLEELLFVHNDEIYFLLYTNFGAIEAKELHRFNDGSFTKLNLTAPSAVTKEDTTRVVFAIADGQTDDGKRVLLMNGSSDISVATLDISGDNATIEHVHNVTEEGNRLRGTAIAGVVYGEKLLIAFGVMGCGYRWERHRLISVDLVAKTDAEVDIPGEYNEGPQFCFGGAMAFALLRNGDWLHATGKIQVGMCDSKYDGSLWVLRDAVTSPHWVKLDTTFPDQKDASIVVDAKENTVYAISTDKILSAAL